MNDKIAALLAQTPRPTTWGQLLDAVMPIIDAEPLRLRMNSYKIESEIIPDYVHWKEHKGTPECGTVACVIGWGSIITGYESGWSIGLRLLERTADEASHRRHVRNFARPLYDLTHKTENWPEGVSGTRAYADEVLAKLRAIREQFRDELDATPLELEAQ